MKQIKLMKGREIEDKYLDIVFKRNRKLVATIVSTQQEFIAEMQGW